MLPIEEKEFREAIKATHGVDSQFVESTPVHLMWEGKSIWKGIVDLFELVDHPKAEHCYAWRFYNDRQWRYTTVLEIPPVIGPQSAVKVGVAHQIKKARENKSQT